MGREAEQVLGAFAGIDILVPSITLVGKPLKHLVALHRLPATTSECKSEKGDHVVAGESLDPFEYCLGALGSEVGDTIGTENHPVGGLAVVAFPCKPVGEVYPGLNVGSSIRGKAVDRIHNMSALAN